MMSLINAVNISMYGLDSPTELFKVSSSIFLLTTLVLIICFLYFCRNNWIIKTFLQISSWTVEKGILRTTKHVFCAKSGIWQYLFLQNINPDNCSNYITNLIIFVFNHNKFKINCCTRRIIVVCCLCKSTGPKKIKWVIVIW